MSKEFEEVVLKKLDELSTELKDTKQELIDLAKDTNQRFETVEEGQKDISKRLVTVEEGQKDINKRLGIVEIDLKDTKEIVMDLSQRFTVFDFEINRKIDTLFDSDTVNKENIVSLNVKNYNHDTRITNLENKDLRFAKI